MDNNFDTLIYNSENDTFEEISEQSTTYDVTNNRIVKTTKNIYDNQRKLIKKIETQVKYIHNSVGTFSSISEETRYSPNNGKILGTKTIEEFYENGTLKERSEEEKNTDENKTYIINKKEIYTHGEIDTLKRSMVEKTLNQKEASIKKNDSNGNIVERYLKKTYSSYEGYLEKTIYKKTKYFDNGKPNIKTTKQTEYTRHGRPSKIVTKKIVYTDDGNISNSLSTEECFSYNGTNTEVLEESFNNSGKLVNKKHSVETFSQSGRLVSKIYKEESYNDDGTTKRIMTLEEEYDANNNNDKPVIANSEEKIFSENENVITNIERNKDKEKKIIRRRAQNGVDSDETIETDKDGNLISYEYIKSDSDKPYYLYHVRMFSDEKDTNHYIVSLYDPLRVSRNYKGIKVITKGDKIIEEENGICKVSFKVSKNVNRNDLFQRLKNLNFKKYGSVFGLTKDDNYYKDFERYIKKRNAIPIIKDSKINLSDKKRSER